MMSGTNAAYGPTRKLQATVVALDSLPNQSPMPVITPTVTAVLGRALSFYVPAYNHNPATHTLTWSIGTISEHDPLLGTYAPTRSLESCCTARVCC